MTIHVERPVNASASDTPIGDLSPEELITRMVAACSEERRLTAEVVACLIEVEKRRLHLRAACSSLFDYCTRHLGMSGGAAHRRINAARLAKEFPCLLPKLASGALHLSGLLILRDHLTKANAEELATAASGLSEAKLHELLAARMPRPPVPERVEVTPGQPSLLAPEQPAPRQSRTEPLSRGTYALQLTMTAETHAKLRRAQDMMRHRQPDGNLAVVIDRALDALLARLEREILAKTARPRARKGVTKGISRATRREVFERDGQQCTYRSEAGDRCPALAFLELDHAAAQGLGGEHGSSNLRVLCQAHNHLHAEDDFGIEHVATRTEERRASARSVPAPPSPPTSPRATGIGPSAEQTGALFAAKAAEQIGALSAAKAAEQTGALCGANAAQTGALSGASAEQTGALSRAKAAAQTGALCGANAAQTGALSGASAEQTGALSRAKAAAQTGALSGAKVAAQTGALSGAQAAEQTGALFGANATRTAAPSEPSTSERERMLVYGLTDMGFARSDCVAVAREVLGRSPAERLLSEVFREAIGVLTSLPRKLARSRRARPAAAWPWT